jgi:hypothetical protein
MRHLHRPDTREDMELCLTHARSARGELLALRDGRKIPLGRCLAGSDRE